MIRVAAIEKALPDDVRRAARDYPLLTVAGAALLGLYLGRSHGREILSALVGLGLSVGVSSARRLLGRGQVSTCHIAPQWWQGHFARSASSRFVKA